MDSNFLPLQCRRLQIVAVLREHSAIFFWTSAKRREFNNFFDYKEHPSWFQYGSTQVVRISEEEREKGIIKNKDREWKKRDHALFVGYAPLEKPKYSICVIVEHGGSGSATAAPIAKDIMEKLLI